MGMFVDSVSVKTGGGSKLVHGPRISSWVAAAFIVLPGLIVSAYGQAPPAPTVPSSPEQSQPSSAPATPAMQVPDSAAQPSQGATQQPLSPVAVSSAQPAPAGTSPSGPRQDKNLTLHAGNFSIDTTGGEIKEEQLKKMLVGKTLYLRGGYQSNSLEFDEKGRILGHSPQGSYTLSQIQISKVKLSKKKLELSGDRYALHFLGSAPYDDPTAATDRVKITPKKKSVRISFDREEVEKSHEKSKEKDGKKKDRHSKNGEAKKFDAALPTATAATTDATVSERAAIEAGAVEHSATNGQNSDRRRTSTKSAVQTSQVLLSALNNVFSVGVDERMIDTMPDFWKLYYQAAEAKSDYRPTDPGVFRQSAVDQKAKLISAIDPPSNEFAQANGVAGIALYHTVVGSDGKVEEIVAGRPIGFGLDESAEQTIRKAAFQPALKDGKPVPVALDLVVSFRIYSKRTSQPAPAVQAGTQKPKEALLPGPYTAQALARAQAQPQEQSQAQPAAAPQ